MKKTNWVLDIETLSNCIIFCFVDFWTEERHHFILWKNKDDRAAFYKFLHRNIDLRERHITFNGLAFDSQIVQWLLNKENYYNSPLVDVDTMINDIYKKSQEIIQRSFNNEFQDFPEWKMQILQLDLFKMNHWDNAAKMASLKWLSCSIDWPNIEDMPYSHTHYVENDKELGIILSYCYNDCDVTKKVLHLSKEGVDIRRDLSKEYSLSLYSASEPRLAKELFLYFLSQKTGIDKRELKKYSTVREKINVNEILLPYIKFERQEFVMLLNNFKKLTINGAELRGAFTYNVKYRGLSIDYGVGGLHADSGPNKYFSDEKNVIIDADVKSYYPNLAIKNKWAPAHINKAAFCDQYEAFYIDRTKFKKGTPNNYLYKILLNSTFGLSIDKTSFLSDPQLGCQITINGQLLLTMLIEMICEAIPEAKPLVANTDGISISIPRTKEAQYYEICKQWEAITFLELEFDNIDKMFSFDCNNFLQISSSGKAKCKGRFEYEAHDKYDTNVLHKNKSFLVVAKAIYEYFANGITPEEYITNHRKIYDFCGFARAKGQWKFVQVTSTGDGVTEKTIQKTLRYFVSKTGSKVVKRKKDEDGKVRQIQVLAGRMHITEFNKFWEKKWDDYNLDYSYYIKEAYREIHILEKPQLTLFE